MLWLSIEEGLPERKFTIVLFSKDRIGAIMLVSEEKHSI
jgi:hypothetical protein